jgi:DNA polymerase-3 subunit alpha
MPIYKELDEKEKLSLEKEVLGMYVTGHPLSQYKEKIQNNTSMDNSKLNALKEDEETFLTFDEKEVIMGGLILNKSIKTTKRNDLMAFLELEDLYGTIEVMVFPKILQKYNTILNEDSIIYVRGTLSIGEDGAKLLANEIIDINDTSKDGLYLKINSINDKDLISEITDIFNKHLGEESVFLFYEDINKLYKWNEVKIDISKKLLEDIEKIMPKENIKVRYGLKIS